MGRRWRKSLVRAVLTVLILFTTWSTWLYVTAPVDALRSRVTYLPPHSHTPREAGLGMPDNLHLADMPAPLIFATLYGEDITFATDHGVRPRKIARNLLAYAEHGGRLSGGSTITQQVVKNAFTGADRTLYRKYVEMIWALRMERDFTKEEIFTLYANMAEVAPGVYGYRAAAELYFHEEPRELTDVEAAFIVNNLPSPEKRTAWFREGTPDATAYERTYALLGNTRVLMARYGVRDVSADARSSLFSGYLRDHSMRELSREEAIAVLGRSRRDAAQFVLSHWSGAPADVGVTTGKTEAKK